METIEATESVRRSTSNHRNKIIEQEIFDSIRYYSRHLGEIDGRLCELENEWDIERAIELNAAVLSLTGVILAAGVNKRWLILPALVTTFLTQHAIQGWCPPVPLLRKLGYRTREEIDMEKYALKILNGDFDIPKRSKEIWEAVKK